MPRILINLSKITAEQIPLVKAFFNAQPVDRKLWLKGKTYRLTNGEQFIFKYDVYQRQREENRPGVRYEVISNKPPLGEGGFAKVKRIKGTLNLETKDLVLKKFGKNGKRRVVKVQTHEALNNNINHLNNEYTLSKRTTHLAIKPPTLIESINTTSYTTMRQAQGVELFKIIDEDFNRINILSTTQRIELTRALLNALKNQVTDLDIVHRDLKPENIMVDPKNLSRVSLLDYGFAFDRHGHCTEPSGTMDFSPPEQFRTLVDVGPKADVYAMGRIIAQIWRVDLSTYQHNSSYLKLPPFALLTNLFTDLHVLDEALKERIVQMLVGMLMHDVDERFTVDEAINCLDTQSPVTESNLAKSGILPRLSFFAKSPAFLCRKSNGSCFSTAQIQAIQARISQLKQESVSCGYANKERKLAKIAGLEDLLEYSSKTNNVDEMLRFVEKKHPALRLGQVSTRTADLLDQLRERQPKSNHKFKMA